MGPDSFNLPSDLDLNNNDGGSTIGDHGEEEGGSSKAKKKKYKNENVVLFDEFGRYIIEDYDANPPFSDILPVSSQQLVVVVVPNYSAILLCWFHHNSYSYILLTLNTSHFTSSGSSRNIRQATLRILRQSRTRHSLLWRQIQRLPYNGILHCQ